jgi:glycogen operon protein
MRLTSLRCASGSSVPLLLGGDEMSRTQGGNNNAYCQDSPISWFDWSDDRRNDPLIAFTQAMIAMRRELPVLRGADWTTGEPDADGRCDLAWYNVWGLPMTQDEWTTPTVHCVAALLDGRFAPVQGQPSPSVLLLFNASAEEVTFTLPQQVEGIGPWRLRLHTGEGCFQHDEAMRVGERSMLELHAHGMAVLVECLADGAQS